MLIEHINTICSSQYRRGRIPNQRTRARTNLYWIIRRITRKQPYCQRSDPWEFSIDKCWLRCRIYGWI